MTNARLTRLDKGLGIVLPREALEHLHAADGDLLEVHPTEHGIELRRNDLQHETARQVIAENTQALRRLAE